VSEHRRDIGEKGLPRKAFNSFAKHARVTQRNIDSEVMLFRCRLLRVRGKKKVYSCLNTYYALGL
jgi:hypothetical protein